ncbi:PHP domain-containing protein [Methanospirillum purgamenti]|uniref:PHP domain-containing protein n=1 Tax=Methanospirillum hungatei TaxID=2203 RepID=A0A8F5ZDQ6_METHU|nr:PHP domain-containing protein [Methanospirillum hungatei]QXO93565.1 PHP domain-containing protein [Methanospirillum hungatei]
MENQKFKIVADFHIHSKYSYDSLLSPKKILKIAKKRGLNTVALTDHNSIRGGIETQKFNNDPNFHVIIGSEINTEIGDIIGIYLNEDIKSRESIVVIEEIKAQGGMVILPHPYRGHVLYEQIISQCDAIEIFNSRSSIIENNSSLELARKFKKPFVAGSDAHFSCEIGLSKNFLNNNQFKETIAFPFSHKNIFGNYSPNYLIHYSQLIKSIKTRNLKKIPYDFFKITSCIFHH